jgi:hypothetical protein
MKKDNRNLLIAALLGGALNSSLSYLSGDGVNITKGANDNTFALVPSLPSVSFNASYTPPKTKTIGTAFIAGGIIAPAVYLYYISRT